MEAVGASLKQFKQHFWGSPPYEKVAGQEAWRWYTFKFAITRRYGEGMAIPKRFGLAFWDFERDIVHFTLLPSNLLFVLIMNGYYYVKWRFPHRINKAVLDSLVKKAYEAGRDDAILSVRKYGLPEKM